VKRDPSIEAYRLLRRFVPEFREFVRGQLVACYGAGRWLDGVPDDVRQRLGEFEKKWGENPWVGTRAESPLDFSYEEDLIRIVTEEHNWRNVFRKWFGSDKRVIETKLREIRWIRDDVAHFRAVEAEQLVKLSARCKEINLCIARAAKIQADSEAPERLLPPGKLLAGDKDPAELLASVQKRAAAARRGEMQAVTDEQLAAMERSLLDLIFEQGAYPDESDVEATAIHWRFNEWQSAPETEVLACQVYVPTEPVPRGSTVYLAIRYNPAAVRARRRVKRNAKPPFNPRSQPFTCQILITLTERFGVELQETARMLESDGWTYWRYTPQHLAKYEVRCYGEPDPEGSRSLWVRAEFVVRRRRRTTARKQR
jgi:hypothetical protein